MIPERQKVCEECDYLNRGVEQSAYCKQKCYPITYAEKCMLGVKDDTEITPKDVERLMDISMKPECKERLLRIHPIEWWYNKMLTRYF